MKSPFGSVIDRQLHSFSNLLAPQWLHERMIQKENEWEEVIWGSERPGKNSEPNQFKPHYCRPPGALASEKKFQQACTRCNDCIVACPHGVIFNLGPYSGPVLNTNLFACHLCEDFPCIQSCDEGALLPMPENTLPWFGTAHLVEEHCLNYGPNRKSSGRAKKRTPYCKLCVEACPVDAIQLNQEKLPEIEDHCTGCGLCIQSCPVDPVAFRILW